MFMIPEQVLKCVQNSQQPMPPLNPALAELTKVNIAERIDSLDESLLPQADPALVRVVFAWRFAAKSLERLCGRPSHGLNCWGVNGDLVIKLVIVAPFPQ